jgi:hypothetical protein
MINDLADPVGYEFILLLYHGRPLSVQNTILNRPTLRDFFDFFLTEMAEFYFNSRRMKKKKYPGFSVRRVTEELVDLSSTC